MEFKMKFNDSYVAVKLDCDEIGKLNALKYKIDIINHLPSVNSFLPRKKIMVSILCPKSKIIL